MERIGVDINETLFNNIKVKQDQQRFTWCQRNQIEEWQGKSIVFVDERWYDMSVKNMHLRRMIAHGHGHWSPKLN